MVVDYCRLNSVVAQHRGTMTKMLEKIAPKRCFITLSEQGQAVACGLAVADTGFVGLFDLITDTDFRNRGLGEQLVLNLLEWGKQNGAQRAYLQVMLNNALALHLYDKLGFKEVYQYWYRVKP
jgi:ribosomal protein S18 acetylase RimI-like enzyme